MNTSNSITYLTLSLFLGIFLAFPPQYVQAQSDLIQLTDLLKIKQLGSVTHSPDGKSVVFTVTDISDHNDDVNPYRYQTHLWIAPTDGSRAARQLTFGENSASQPAWHPDGKRLAFTRAHEGRSQIFVLSFEGGEPVPVTNHSRGASAPRWSPDGKHLMFSSSMRLSDMLKDSVYADGPTWPLEQVRRTPGDILSDVKPNPDGNIDEIRAWLHQNTTKSNPRVLTRLNFQAETDLNPEITFSHIFVQPDQPNAEAKALTDGFFSFGGANWSTDSKTIYFNAALDSSTHPDRVINSDIYKMNADGSGKALVASHDEYILSNPNISPNGQILAFQARGNAELSYTQTEIWIKNLRTGNIQPLTRVVDRTAGNITWSPDSRFIYFTANSNGGTILYRANVQNGNIDRLTSFEKGIRSFDVSAGVLSYVLTQIANPFELYSANLSTARNASGENILVNKRRISDINTPWLANKRLSYPEKGVLQNDGFDVEYWIMKPTDFNEENQYPLMLQIHGGPSAMWGPGEASMWFEFQYFAARGYGIVYSNPRGSGGYGYDFQKGNYRDWGHGPASDVLAATDIAAALNWTDPERLVTTGGSYAGYLVAWIVAHDHRFKAAFAQRGVYDLHTFLGEGNAWRLVPNHFGGFPWEAEVDSVMRANSPQTFVGNIQTPLLIKHGDVDLRTGVIQSEMLYKALKIQDKPVEFVRYPRASHEMSRSGEVLQRMDRILRIYEFFERYVN